MGLHKGDVIDERYQLEELLGSGAFAEVWKASQLADGEAIGVTCAVKVMRLPRERGGEGSPRTFTGGWIEEVRNLVKVTGDTIPRIHEASVWNEHAYIAMELLDGSTLAARLTQGPIPWRRALFIADQIAQALEAAHQLGMVHRDLKPQNVMLVGPRRVCVVDWGIAWVDKHSRVAASDLAGQPSVRPKTTDPFPVAVITTPLPQRVAAGTPGYMAPEAREGARPGAAQDVYSLGVVLYEMIAGSLPHAVEPIHRGIASTDAIKAYRVSLDKATMDHDLVPLRERCPEVPVGVAYLVDSLLASQPERRPGRLRDAIAHASRFPHGIPDPPYPGLRTLSPRRAGLYYGQHDAIHHVLDRLRTQRAALLWGPSGAGKSSLALAGVAATMDRTLFLDMDGWDIHVIRPREGQGFRVVSDGPRSERPQIGHVIVVDQLEEVVDLGPAARSLFCAAVLALLDRSAPVLVRDTVIGVTDEVKLIATIRDDLEWRVDREVPALRPLLERRIIVKGVDANFARSIIQEPPRALRYEVEGVEAVSREVEERLSADPAKLPVIQYALSEWWERRDDQRRVLPLAAWQELGGVDGALSFVAERFFSGLDHGDAMRVKGLFIRLFHWGRKQPLADSELDPRDRILMERLTGLRLVARREKQAIGPFYEVEHEYLAANWARLAGWLAEARDDRMLADELERDAVAYQRDPDPERLWRRGRLASAVELAEAGRVALNTSAKEFVHQAERREKRGRLILRAAIVAGLAIIFGVGYVGLLNRAVHEKTREERRIAAEKAANAETALAEAKKRQAMAEDKLNAAVLQKKQAEDLQSQARADVKRSKDELDAKQQELEQRSTDIDTKERHAEHVKDRLNRAEAQRSDADQRATQAEERTNAAEQRAQDLGATVSKAEQHAQDLEARASEADQRTRAAEADRDAAAKAAKEAQRTMQEAQQKMQEALDRAKIAEARVCTSM